jgi:hypothetical protein
MPLLPTVTVSLAGLDVMDGGEFVGGGFGDGGGVGFVGGGGDGCSLERSTMLEHPDTNVTRIITRI